MKKLLTSIMAIVLALACCLGLTACGDNKETSAIADGKLTIGYTIYAPMNYTDDNSNFVGFDTELAKAFCEEIGVQAEFVEINWNNKFIDLETKAIDCIWNGMTITDAVKEKTAVSSPYFENKQVIVCKPENAHKYTDANSILSASSVAFEKGSAGELVVSDINLPQNKRVEAGTQKEALLEVFSGSSEIAVIDSVMARFMTTHGTYSSLTYVDVGFDNEFFGVAFRKVDAGLAKAFDLFIKLYKTSGDFDLLNAKYFD